MNNLINKLKLFFDLEDTEFNNSIKLFTNELETLFFDETKSNEDIIYFLENNKLYESNITIRQATISTATSDQANKINPSCFNFGVTLINKEMKNWYIPLDFSFVLNLSSEGNIIGKKILILYLDQNTILSLNKICNKCDMLVRIK